jgi:hypothetical protein
MQEAREKADVAMQQATTAMVTGIVAASLQIGGAVAQLKDMVSKAKGDLLQVTRIVRLNAALTA